MTDKFTITRLPSEPILLCQVAPYYSPNPNMEQLDTAVSAILDRADESLFCVSDLTNITFDDSDLLVTVARSTVEEQALWRHPKLRKLVLVTSLPIIHTALDAIQARTAGGRHVEVFETLDEALVYCRAQIAADA